MNILRNISIITVFAAITSIAAAQSYPEEYLGLPGDNLNLYAVMNLFQESETLEAFERSLNDQENTINNLDLNGDNYVYYITVSDYVDKNVHTIVLRTSLDRNEQQDIAVFVVEKLRNDEVQIQLIGDEALYGPDYIVEPIYAETPNPGYTGNANVYKVNYYQIAAWPVITYIYHPRYRVWRSSWYWVYYPTYWHAWRPHYWHYYYGYHSHWHNHYYSHYRHWNHYRSRSYKTYYHNNVRVYSHTVVNNINRGRYTTTYSRPDQRRAGEQYYAQRSGQRNSTERSSVSTQRNQSRSATAGQRQGTTRSTVTGRETGSRVNTTRQGKQDAVRSSSTRSNSQRANQAVQNRSSQRSSTSSVSRSTGQRSKAAVSERSSQRTRPAVQSRSTGQRSSASSVSRSTGQRSKAAVSGSSSQRKSSVSTSRNSSSRSSDKKSASKTGKGRSDNSSRR